MYRNSIFRVVKPTRKLVSDNMSQYKQPQQNGHQKMSYRIFIEGVVGMDIETTTTEWTSTTATEAHVGRAFPLYKIFIISSRQGKVDGSIPSSSF